MKRYSKDFKLSIVKAVVSKRLSKEEAWKVYGCSRTSLTIWLRQYKNTGDCQALPPSGRKCKLFQDDMTNIQKLVEAKPDITLDEIREELSLDVTKSTIHYYLKRMGYSYKKKLYMPENKKEKMLE